MNKETKVTVLPETKSAITNQGIESSIKIARQTIKSELTKQQKTLTSEIANLKAKTYGYDSKDEIIKRFDEILEEAVTMEVQNDGDMHCLVQAWNFINYPEVIESNHELITEIKAWGRARDLVNCSWSNIGMFRNFINDESKTLSIGIELSIGAFTLGETKEVRNNDYVDIDRGLQTEITCPHQILEFMEESLPDLIEIEALKNKLVLVNRSLDNLPETLEQIEAKLLIQDLVSTPEGENVLAITGNIINDVVGSKVLLTDGTK